jgi:hypothetical protein
MHHICILEIIVCMKKKLCMKETVGSKLSLNKPKVSSFLFSYLFEAHVFFFRIFFVTTALCFASWPESLNKYRHVNRIFR